MTLPESSQEKKKSGNIWKWILLGCGGLTLVGIIAIAGLVYLVSRNLSISLDPEKAQENVRDLFDYEIPGGDRGTLALNMFGIEMSQVSDLNNPPSVFLTVGQVPFAWEDEEREAFQEGFQESFFSQETIEYNVTSERLEEKNLCEQTVNVSVSEGTMNVGANQVTLPAIGYTATVNYNGSERFVSLITNGEMATETVESVFNSLECK
ncbi:MAG: hypothetical protein AB4290_14120 [Spirulina sp.]